MAKRTQYAIRSGKSRHRYNNFKVKTNFIWPDNFISFRRRDNNGHLTGQIVGIGIIVGTIIEQLDMG